jgi:methionyl-tRNA formyltransferase
MHLGSEAVIETLELIEKGNVTTIVQTESAEIKTAYKLNKETAK